MCSYLSLVQCAACTTACDAHAETSNTSVRVQLRQVVRVLGTPVTPRSCRQLLSHSSDTSHNYRLQYVKVRIRVYRYSECDVTQTSHGDTADVPYSHTVLCRGQRQHPPEYLVGHTWAPSVSLHKQPIIWATIWHSNQWKHTSQRFYSLTWQLSLRATHQIGRSLPQPEGHQCIQVHSVRSVFPYNLGDIHDKSPDCPSQGSSHARICFISMPVVIDSIAFCYYSTWLAYWYTASHSLVNQYT